MSRTPNPHDPWQVRHHQHPPSRWEHYRRYGYPLTTAYLVVMVTVIVILLLLDPNVPTN